MSRCEDVVVCELFRELYVVRRSGRGPDTQARAVRQNLANGPFLHTAINDKALHLKGQLRGGGDELGEGRKSFATAELHGGVAKVEPASG